MASPLNVFKTVTAELSDSNSIIYTAPSGFTGIILMAQASNVSANTEQITFSHYDASIPRETELVKGFDIPSADAAGLITGKLVLETGDSVRGFASTASTIKITLSVLESLNE